MNEVLLEVFRHNAWATKRLLAFCRELPETALTSTTPGTYGTIFATFDHFIHSDASYLLALDGPAPRWAAEDRVGISSLDVLDARADESAAAWERFLSEPVDVARVLLLENGTYEVSAGILFAQTLHHGNVHREQICAILTGLGIEPPDIQPWGFADETGRSRWK